MQTTDATGRRRGTRWWEWAPEVVLVAGLGYFLLDETDAATSAFESTRAIALMALGLGAWVVVRLALTRFVPRPAVRTGVMSVMAAAILAVVVVPAYRDTTVIEELPVALAVADEGAARTAAPSLPPAAAAPAPAPPRRILSGSFRGLDHRANGTVNVYVRSDGSSFVGLEEFDIQPGPDYDVYVVPGVDRTDPEGGHRLDDLRGNVGTQFYEVPPGTDVGSGGWTVLIWCQTFDVPVANATPV